MAFLRDIDEGNYGNLLCRAVNLSWNVAGDFNHIICYREKHKPYALEWLVLQFRNTVHVCSLIDLSLVGYSFN